MSRPRTPNTTREMETEPLVRSSSGSDPSERRGKQLDLAPTKRDKTASVFLLIGVALFLPLTWYITLHAGLSAGWFIGHPPLMSLSITLYILAIAPLQPPPTSGAAGGRKAKFNIHQYTMGLAIPLMSLGVAAMWWNKHVHSANHFTTWHSWFGVFTVGWVVLQGLVGGASVWGGGWVFGGKEKGKRVWKWHRLSGYILVTLALITAHLGGAHSTWSQNQPLVPRIAAFWVGLPLIWLGLILRIRTSKMQVLA